MIPIVTETIVNAATAATGNADATNPQNFHVTRFFVTLQIGTAATVLVQASTDGANWATLGTVNAAGTSVVEAERPWSNLKVAWSGNSGSKTITVVTEQMHTDPHGSVS